MEGMSNSVRVFFPCRLFPTDLFEIFIDIGHYVRDISAYEELVSRLNLLVVSREFKILAGCYVVRMEFIRATHLLFIYFFWLGG